MIKHKIRLNILIAIIALACSTGFQQLMVGEILTKYEKSCFFFLVWLCISKIFED
nr:MAG TPA: hypothetical protein [Caudoviricetes sp.]